jgi:hypothetical protein
VAEFPVTTLLRRSSGLLFIRLDLSLREKTVFENPEVAKYVLQRFLDINDQMDESILVVEKDASAEEYKAFKRGVGYVIYEVFEKIIEPICKRHPSLKPPEMEA